MIVSHDDFRNYTKDNMRTLIASGININVFGIKGIIRTLLIIQTWCRWNFYIFYIMLLGRFLIGWENPIRS